MPYVHEPADDRPLPIADRLGGNVGRSRYGSIVCQFDRPAVFVSELGDDLRLAGEQTELGPVEPRAQQLIDRLLKRLGRAEHRDPSRMPDVSLAGTTKELLDS